MPKPHKADEVFRILKRRDPRFQVFENRGKGSHRMIYHPDISGQKASFPVPYHKGQDLRQGILRALLRRFGLPHDLFG